MSGRPPWRSPGASTTGLGDPIPGYTGSGSLRGRRALVVGGVVDGAGLGRAVSVALAKEGAVVAVADSTGRSGLPGAWPLDHRGRDDALLATARLLSALGTRTLPIHCDLATEGGCRAAVAHTALEFGAIDVLAVCSGDRPGEVTRLSSTTWLAQAARVFMTGEASVILPATDGGSRNGTAAGESVPNLPGPLVEALRERGVRVGGVSPAKGDSPADIAAAYVALASRSGAPGAEDGRAGPEPLHIRN